MASGDEGLDRRKYLKGLVASSAAATIAGCGGGNDDTTTSTTTSGGGGDTTTTTESTETETTTSTTEQMGPPMDEAFTDELTISDPTKATYNPFFSGTTWTGGGLHYDNMVAYAEATRENVPQVISDWDIGDETVTLTVNTDYTWMQRDGGEWTSLEPTTAEDVAMKFWQYRFTEDPITEELISDWEVKDDETIALTRKNTDVNDQIFFQRAIVGNPVDTPRSQWGDVFEELKGLSGDELSTQYTEQVVKRKIPLEDLIANGAFLTDELRAKKRIVLTKNPEYPRADQIEVPKFDFLKGGGRQIAVQLLKQDELDYQPNMALDPSVAQTLPAHWQRVVTGGLGGGATYFNFDHPDLGKPEVRRAIVFAVDNGQVVRNVNRTPVDPRISGITNPTMRTNWLGDVIGDFTNYQGNQPDRAAEELESAGYSQDSDGNWLRPDGEPLSFEIKAISNWTTANVMNQTIASQLRNFGIQAEAIGIESSSFFQEHWTDPEQMKSFDMLKFPVFGSFGIFHPIYYMEYFYGSGAVSERAKTGKVFEGVPSEVGRPNSSTTTVDAPALTKELARTEDQERAKEIVETLSWTYNQKAVAFVNNRPAGHAWYSYDEWNLPEVRNPRNPPDEFVSWGPKELMAQGVLTPKRQEQ